MRSAFSAGHVRISTPHEHAGQRAAGEFRWCRRKLQSAAVGLGVLALPGFACVLASGSILRGGGLGLLLLVAWASDVLVRRAAAAGEAAVVVDHLGIVDRRLGLCLRWQDIAMFWPVASARARVLDVEVRWVDGLLTHPRLRTRLGARIQRSTGLPAVTLNLWLLDGSVADVLAEIRRYRPDLLAPCDLAGRTDATRAR